MCASKAWASRLVLCVAVFLGMASWGEEPKDDEIRKLVPVSGERFTSRIVHDSKTKFSFGWTRALNPSNALAVIFDSSLDELNLELGLDWIHSVGDFSFALGLATSMGKGSVASGEKLYLGKEIGPSIFLEYTNWLIEARSFTDFWIPVQESQATALWSLKSRLWVIGKWNDFGIGPRAEIEIVKDGNSAFSVHETAYGGFLVKYWRGASFSLFLGYDTASMASFQGSPKHPGFVYRGVFAYSL